MATDIPDGPRLYAASVTFDSAEIRVTTDYWVTFDVIGRTTPSTKLKLVEQWIRDTGFQMTGTSWVLAPAESGDGITLRRQLRKGAG